VHTLDEQADLAADDGQFTFVAFAYLTGGERQHGEDLVADSNWKRVGVRGSRRRSGFPDATGQSRAAAERRIGADDGTQRGRCAPCVSASQSIVIAINGPERSVRPSVRFANRLEDRRRGIVE